jgi:SOS response regulatory protein OraA/RecX
MLYILRLSLYFFPMREKPQKPILEKLADLIALRTHSEFELQQKLLHKSYSETEVQEALEEARKRKWLEDPRELATRTASQLHAKNKSYAYIAAYLEQKNLPLPVLDEALELEKALSLVKTQVLLEPPYDDHGKTKIANYLQNRQFDEATIRKVIYEVR